MSLRTIAVGNSIPFSFPVSMSGTFFPGQICQLFLQGSTPVAGPSTGNCPIGIIDDIRASAFSAVSWDEEVTVPNVTGALVNGKYITTQEYKVELENPNISPDTFVSIPLSVQLIPRNGVVVFPIGTEINADLIGNGIPNAIRTFVRYNYAVPYVNVAPENSVIASNRISVWFQRGIYQTDIFDTTASYPLNANLFVNRNGLLTTKQEEPNFPSVGICTCPPNATWSWLEFLWI